MCPTTARLGGDSPLDPYADRPATILLADDDHPSRALLRAFLEPEYRVIEAVDGTTTLARVEADHPDLVLLDVRMPAPDGLEVLRLLRRRPATALLPIILVTALVHSADRIAGLDAGATDFVSKPFDAPELLARIRSALRTSAALERLETAQSVLVALANAVEAKDPTTEHHCDRIAGLATGLARLAGLDASAIEVIGYGAALHDVGKIGVSELLLRKPGPLSEPEWAEMRRHPLMGATIVEPLRLGRLVAPIVRGHHERWDGTGYPDGLRGAAIPIGARVVAVVDAYDAMTHDRPYREGLPTETALTEIRGGAGSQFDPELAALFLEHSEGLVVPSVDEPPDAARPYTQGLLLPA